MSDHRCQRKIQLLGVIVDKRVMDPEKPAPHYVAHATSKQKGVTVVANVRDVETSMVANLYHHTLESVRCMMNNYFSHCKGEKQDFMHKKKEDISEGSLTAFEVYY